MMILLTSAILVNFPSLCAQDFPEPGLEDPEPGNVGGSSLHLFFETVLDPTGNSVILTAKFMDQQSDTVLTFTQENNPSSSIYLEFLIPEKMEYQWTFPAYPVESATISYGSTYIPTQISGEPIDLHPETLSIPPAPCRIISFEKLEYDPKEKNVVITLGGSDFISGVSIKVTFTSSNPQESSQELTFSYANASAITCTAILYSEDGQTDLSYGSTYTLDTAVSVDGTTLIALGLDPISFKIIEEPARITKLIAVTLDQETMKEATITLKGVAMVEGHEYKLILEDADDGTEAAATVKVGSDGNLTGTANVYLSAGKVTYGHNYTILSASPLIASSSSLFIEDNIEIPIKSEPTRVIDVQASLASDHVTASVFFTVRALTASTLSFTPQQENSDSLLFTETDQTGLEMPEGVTLLKATSTDLEIGFTYLIEDVYDLDQNKILVEPGLSFRLPFPPTISGITSALASSLPTRFTITLSGTDLPTSGDYIMIVKDVDPIPFTFNTQSIGTSPELEIGWPDSFQFIQPLTAVSVVLTSDPTQELALSVYDFNTPPRSASDVLYLNESGSTNERNCGSVNKPCASVDVAMKIVSGISMDTATLKLIEAASFSTPISVADSDMLTITKYHKTSTMTVFPSSSPDIPLVSVEGMFTLQSLTLISPTWTNDKVLVEAKQGEVLLESLVMSFAADRMFWSLDSVFSVDSCRFVGTKQPNSDSLDTLCTWSTGLIHLDNTTTTIRQSVFSHLSMGAIWMKNSSLTLLSTEFLSNTVSNNTYPSAHRNIHCEDSTLTIESLMPSGDGGDGSQSLWIDASDDCEIESEQKLIFEGAPLFVPFLNSSSSTSVKNKKDAHFVVGIVGTMLIPCGLSLELFEWSKKDEKEGKNAFLLPLTSPTSEWTETSISVTITIASFSSFESSLDWRARLVFGRNCRTADSFSILSNSSSSGLDPKSFLFWMIPLIVGVLVAIVLFVIILLCLHRRSKNRKNEQTAATELVEEVDAEVIQKLDVEEMDPTNSSCLPAKNENFIDVDITVHPIVSTAIENKPFECLCCDENMQTAYFNKADTLFDRLHKTKDPTLNKKQLKEQVTRGLARMIKQYPNAPILVKLSPYWIVFDPMGNSMLRLSETEDMLNQPGNVAQNDHTQPMQTDWKDGQRWLAPELAKDRANITLKPSDVHHGTVFSLGLILWEIETGCVPFAEYDAVNTQRLLGAGSTPDLTKIDNTEERELVQQCLSLKATDRPSLHDVSSFYASKIVVQPPVPQGNDSKLHVTDQKSVL